MQRLKNQYYFNKHVPSGEVKVRVFNSGQKLDEETQERNSVVIASVNLEQSFF